MKAVKRTLLIPILLILLCFSGYILLVLSYCIPVARIEKNMALSAEVFEREGTYPQTITQANSRLDNFTDSLMLLTAAYPAENVWTCAAAVPHYSGNPRDVLISVYSGAERPFAVPYARYWHGYVVFLRPLLLFFNYGTIRYFLIFVQMGLFVLLISKLSRTKKCMVLPTFLFWIFLNPVTTMLSLQFNTVLTITFLAMLAVLYADGHWKPASGLYSWGILFLLIGAVTNYLDLLTYPLVTLGAPLILWLGIRLAPAILENCKRILLASLFWFTGYAGMWASKWILGSIITGTNVIQDARSTIQFRTSSVYNGVAFRYIDVLKAQWDAARSSPWKFALLILLLFLLCKMLRSKSINLNLFVSCLLPAVFPFVWYFVLKNHSFIHNFFAYREFSISLYALASLCMIYEGRREQQT